MQAERRVCRDVMRLSFSQTSSCGVVGLLYYSGGLAGASEGFGWLE